MKFFIKRLNGSYIECIADGFAFLGSAGIVQANDRIAIKPNLTYPQFKPGVMTTVDALKAVVSYLKEFTEHITICESDSGGYNPFSMDEVFRATGIAEFARKHNVQVVNMSTIPSRNIEVRAGMRRLSIPLPTLLLDDTDRFITMPVPKVHCNTTVSLSMKNQWGVIQHPAVRLTLHPYFQEVIYAVNAAMPGLLTIIDGQYGLTRNGPMRGDVKALNWIAMSDNLYRADSIVAEIMGFDPRAIPHIRYALNKEGINVDQPFECNCDYRRFMAEPPFYLERAWTDLPGLAAFKSRLIAYLGYESILAQPLHKLLYLFREPFY